MKTNVNMVRKMGDYEIIQRTRDGMFNATLLLKQWNARNNANKQIDRYFNNKATKELIEAIRQEVTDLHTQNCVYVKSRASRGNNAGTWMHPFLFIDFAMWINPKFKLKVIKFVYDELIKHRHIAGDNYRLLASSASIFPDTDYRQIAKGLNYIVFGKHKKEIRNFATPEQLNELHEIEKQLAFAIDMGLIKNYAQLIKTMRDMYHKKYDKF